MWLAVNAAELTAEEHRQRRLVRGHGKAGQDAYGDASLAFCYELTSQPRQGPFLIPPSSSCYLYIYLYLLLLTLNQPLIT